MKKIMGLIIFCAATIGYAQGGVVKVSGELKQWHKVTISLKGPFAKETDAEPNPFTDYRMDVVFSQGGISFKVPGYFAADGDAAESSASEGNIWRAHFAPNKAGVWNYTIHFAKGLRCAVNDGGEPLKLFDGLNGIFKITLSDKTGEDFRSKGRLSYVGKRYLQFEGNGECFLKAGPDAPETLLAFADFDGTRANTPKKCPLKKWQAHVQDWKVDDPIWKDGKGKGLIGAVNYISSKGCNSISFLPYNAGGDGDNVWPFIERNEKFHYDCSKLDQWGIVFDHAVSKGVHLHFKLQETEIDDNRRGHKKSKSAEVRTSLDGGKLGPERKLYCRELVARFGHLLALNWNIGEENTQSTEEIKAMAEYIKALDAYDHHIVIHTFPNQQDKVYPPLLGEASPLTGVSLQNSWKDVHRLTLKWIKASAKAGKQWVVANDEQNPAGLGVPPDPDFKGNTKVDPGYTMHDIRKLTLWGNLMAGGAGVEYYFGYKLAENDLRCEDYRSRDKNWDYCRIALEFFKDNKIPLADMNCMDELVGNPKNENTRFCLAKPGDIYLVYLTAGGTCDLNLKETSGTYSVKWFNPRKGGSLQKGSVKQVNAGLSVNLGGAPAEKDQDWLVVVKQR